MLTLFCEFCKKNVPVVCRSAVTSWGCINKEPSHEATPEEAAKFGVSEALKALGFDLEDENFSDTPARFVRYLQEYCKPFNPIEVLKIGFNHEHAEVAGYKGMVVQTNIPWRTICPHHLLPVTGRCHVGYIPTKRVVGLSKITRLAQAVGTEKPRMQETCTDIIAELLSLHLEAKGVIVVISAEHGCMYGRGVHTPDTPSVTSTVRGLFRDVPAAREEFFELVRINHVT